MKRKDWQISQLTLPQKLDLLETIRDDFESKSRENKAKSFMKIKSSMEPITI
jgi:hypothetical protein